MQFIQPSVTQLLELKTWFVNSQQILTWGGPSLTYPMADDAFLSVVITPNIQSFGMLDDAQELLAFGQYYRRLGRHHLGRLAVNPKHRGKGLGKILIKNLLIQATAEDPHKEASLFVFLDNHIAYQCYQSLGFKETDYPGGVPGNMPNCTYMVLSNLV